MNCISHKSKTILRNLIEYCLSCFRRRTNQIERKFNTKGQFRETPSDFCQQSSKDINDLNQGLFFYVWNYQLFMAQLVIPLTNFLRDLPAKEKRILQLNILNAEFLNFQFFWLQYKILLLLELMLQSGYKLTRKKFENQFELDNDLVFFNAQYPFPNDLQIYNNHKSFKTIFEFNGTQLPQHYTKRLSLLNRIHYTIKLKQIKREEIGPQTSSSHFIRFLLYYEPLPYSLSFARQNSKFVSITPAKLQKILYQTLKDLIDLNIYCQLATSYCGFTQNGQFRIFIPPSAILKERKLYLTDKQAIMSSADRIVKFWQIQAMKPRETPLIDLFSRTSYRFNSPQPKKQTLERSNNEDDNIDFKKTIKLSKNYTKEIIDQKLKIGSKLSDLKKHKSLQILQAEASNQRKEKKGYQYLTKIQNLNKKIDNIRMAINRRKTLQQRPQIQSFYHEDSKECYQNNLYQMKDLAYQEENSQGQVIFDKQQDYNNCSLIKHNNYSVIKNNKSQTKIPTKYQQHQNKYKQSIDTYEQWMGRDYNQVNFEPNPKLRRTALPILQKLKNADSILCKPILHHQSAGNRVLKRIIQKNKEIYPQMFINRENGSISKKSAGLILQMQPSLRSAINEKVLDNGRLKKIVSLDAFQSHLETKSINLSQYSNDLSNFRKRQERELKNKEMKQKVQQVLIKSKKAIELLKKPAKYINKW